MQFFGHTNIDFLSKRIIIINASLAFLVIGLIATIILGPKLGIDFTGGLELAYKFDKPVNTEEIRKAMSAAGIKSGEIKSYGEENQFLIRIKESEHAPELVNAALTKAFPNVKLEVLKSEKIEPKIGSEIALQAVLSVALAVIAILIYVAFRFEFTFGIGAVVALVHDVLITFAVVVMVSHLNIINLEMNQSFVAAILTVVGYSINDTVIIFDRIRENKEKTKGSDFIKIANMSINETLSRTVNTVGTTVIVLVVLLFFGGPVLEGFAFIMLFGILIGTFSSVFVATPIVILYLQKIKKINIREMKDLETIQI